MAAASAGMTGEVLLPPFSLRTSFARLKLILLIALALAFALALRPIEFVCNLIGVGTVRNFFAFALATIP